MLTLFLNSFLKLTGENTDNFAVVITVKISNNESHVNEVRDMPFGRIDPTFIFLYFKIFNFWF